MLTQKLAQSNPLATELAGYISTETNRLSALVTRFLDFARPLHADLAPRAAGVVIGDLSSAAETRAIADQVNRIGRMNAVIHNAGVYLEPSRGPTAEAHRHRPSAAGISFARRGRAPVG